MENSFETETEITVGGERYRIFDVSRLAAAARLPYCLKVLLENLLRHEDGDTVKRGDVEALLARGRPGDAAPCEIAFRPARVLMQDFTGVPAVVDLAAMRDAIAELGKDPALINPLQPAELVIDHSVQVDRHASGQALDLNTRIEFERNRERYNFLKWGQQAFSNFKVVPPGAGIVHQVNLEYLARVVFSQRNGQRDGGGSPLAYPDTLVGTDSHTTMINGAGVLGWGVGGIEAEAAMLGQPISMLLPKVVGFRLSGELPEGATATDLVLIIVERLREHGVVGKFVEFCGSGLDHLSLGDRATIANMAPEYGATCGFFPVDEETLSYLRLSGRDADHLELIETYAKTTGLWRDDQNRPDYDEELHLDLAQVMPSIAGPRRPQDRVPLNRAKTHFAEELKRIGRHSDNGGAVSVELAEGADAVALRDGFIAIAAITSCTNTSNPSVMLSAGLLAKNAVARGLAVAPWVKTSLAPGSRVVTDYLENAGLMAPLQALGFHTVGYGCTTCIGNSGPLPPAVAAAIEKHDLIAAAVLSGNRNFEGRIHADVRMNYLASPPLVVAYALAGSMNVDLHAEPLGRDAGGAPVFLKDIWPSNAELKTLLAQALAPGQFRKVYDSIYEGTDDWRELRVANGGDAGGGGLLYPWPDSTYVAHPPYFEQMRRAARDEDHDIRGARVLALLGDSVTTDHISPAGAIAADSPAGLYLQEKGVLVGDFNSYGSRRGNHEVMVRGTFANVRLRNKLAPATEGGYTRHLPSGDEMTIYDAAMRYLGESTPVIVIAGREYGSGSSRDWAAKGPKLQGVRAVIAESFERIHRSNLVGMGILPLQFADGENAEKWGLTGEEVYDVTGLAQIDASGGRAEVTATDADGARKKFTTRIRIDTPREAEYFTSGGILPYVLRQLAAAA